MQEYVWQNNIEAALFRRHERKGNHLTQSSQKVCEAFLCIMLLVFYYLDFFFFLIFIFTLFCFIILYWFHHTLTWISHGCTWVPNLEPPSHLPPHIISLDHPCTPAPSIKMLDLGIVYGDTWNNVFWLQLVKNLLYFLDYTHQYYSSVAICYVTLKYMV